MVFNKFIILEEQKQKQKQLNKMLFEAGKTSLVFFINTYVKTR